MKFFTTEDKSNGKNMSFAVSAALMEDCSLRLLLVKGTPDTPQILQRLFCQSSQQLLNSD